VGLVATVFGAGILVALLWSHPNIGFAMGNSSQQTPPPSSAVVEKTADAPKPVQVSKRHATPLPITSAAGLKTPPPSSKDLVLDSTGEIIPPALPLDHAEQSDHLQKLVSFQADVPQFAQWELAKSEDAEINTPVSMVPPVYPESAKQNKLEGTVVLQILVDKKGKVRRLERVGGDPQLADAAIKAVKQWRYPPYLVNGKPEESNKQVEMRFTLGPTTQSTPRSD
jgi:TonB family protein